MRRRFVQAAIAVAGVRSFSCLVSIAQIIRAILLASAMATSIRSLRASIRASHDAAGIAFLLIQFNRDMAPMMSIRRMSLAAAIPAAVARYKKALDSIATALSARMERSRELLRDLLGEITLAPREHGLEARMRLDWLSSLNLGQCPEIAKLKVMMVAEERFVQHLKFELPCVAARRTSDECFRPF